MLVLIFPMFFVYLIAALLYYNVRIFLRTAAFETLSWWDGMHSHVFGCAVAYMFYWFSRN